MYEFPIVCISQNFYSFIYIIKWIVSILCFRVFCELLISFAHSVLHTYINCDSRFSEIITTYKSECDLNLKGLKNNIYDTTDWSLFSNYLQIISGYLKFLTCHYSLTLFIALHMYDHKYLEGYKWILHFHQPKAMNFIKWFKWLKL